MRRSNASVQLQAIPWRRAPARSGCADGVNPILPLLRRRLPPRQRLVILLHHLPILRRHVRRPAKQRPIRQISLHRTPLRDHPLQLRPIPPLTRQLPPQRLGVRTPLAVLARELTDLLRRQIPPATDARTLPAA